MCVNLLSMNTAISTGAFAGGITAFVTQLTKQNTQMAKTTPFI